MKKIISCLISIIFPRTCSSCGKTLPFSENKNVCDNCFNNFPKIKGLVCKVCSMPLEDGGAHCYDCRDNKNIYFDILKSPYVYENNIKKLIRKFKYSSKTFLSKELAQPMIDLIYKEGWDKQIDVIIPVPLHFIKKYKRGYNQSFLLAQHISDSLEKNIYTNILLRKRYTKAQFGLGRKEREKNLENIFILNEKYIDLIKGKNILIVDDIATTCTTVNQCSKVLKKAKTKKIFAITIARAKNRLDN